MGATTTRTKPSDNGHQHHARIKRVPRPGQCWTIGNREHEAEQTTPYSKWTFGPIDWKSSEDPHKRARHRPEESNPQNRRDGHSISTHIYPWPLTLGNQIHPMLTQTGEYPRLKTFFRDEEAWRSASSFHFEEHDLEFKPRAWRETKPIYTARRNQHDRLHNGLELSKPRLSSRGRAKGM